MIFVFYFFRLRPALAHMALMAVGYAIVLAARGPRRAPRWTAGSPRWARSPWPGSWWPCSATGSCGTIERLAQFANRDPLTELLNRRGFEDAFDIELERARRSSAPLSLVVADLDGLARVNEALGHAAGATRRCARWRPRCDAVKRSFDSAARVGGEEFALLAPDCDEHGAYMLAERVADGRGHRLGGAPGRG